MKFDIEYWDAQGSRVRSDGAATKLVIRAWDSHRDLALFFRYPVRSRKELIGWVGLPWDFRFAFAGGMGALKKLLKEASSPHAAINDKRFRPI